LIYDVSELAASGAPTNEVVERVRSELVNLLHLRGARFDSGAAERPMMRLGHDGRVLLGDRIWRVDRMGLPGPEIELLVQSRGEELGRFVLTPTPGRLVPYGRRVVAVALADQAGAALRPHLHSV
jgi:hypothetical protein